MRACRFHRKVEQPRALNMALWLLLGVSGRTQVQRHCCGAGDWATGLGVPSSLSGPGAQGMAASTETLMRGLGGCVHHRATLRSQVAPTPRGTGPHGGALCPHREEQCPGAGGSSGAGGGSPWPQDLTTWPVWSSGSDRPCQRCEPPRDGAAKGQCPVSPAGPGPAKHPPGEHGGSPQQGGPGARVSPLPWPLQRMVESTRRPPGTQVSHPCPIPLKCAVESTTRWTGCPGEPPTPGVYGTSPQRGDLGPG